MDINPLHIILPVIMAWMGSIEWRLRSMRTEAEKFIDLKQESLRVIQDELRKDITRLEEQIDKLTTALWSLTKK